MRERRSAEEVLNIIDDLRHMVEQGEIEITEVSYDQKRNKETGYFWETGQIGVPILVGQETTLTFEMIQSNSEEIELRRTQFQHQIDQARGSMLQE